MYTTRRSLAIATAVGFITGGVFGAAASPITLLCLGKAGRKGAGKWLAWGAIGLIGSPVCFMLSQGIVNKTQDNFAEQERSTVVASSPSPSPLVSPAASAQPVSEPEVEPVKSDRQLFTETLVSATPGWGAQEQIGILGEKMYDSRKALWMGIDGLPVGDAEYFIGQMLKQRAYEIGINHWDDEQIANMSQGIVKGLYDWNRLNPADLN